MGIIARIKNENSWTFQLIQRYNKVLLGDFNENLVKMTKEANHGKQDLSKAKYIVSFISLKSENANGYSEAADHMMQSVQSQTGFIAAYSAREGDGIGITNSYWSSLEAISAWKTDQTHQAIQEKGKRHWYQWYQIQVSEIVKNYEN